MNDIATVPVGENVLLWDGMDEKWVMGFVLRCSNGVNVEIGGSVEDFLRSETGPVILQDITHWAPVPDQPTSEG